MVAEAHGLKNMLDHEFPVPLRHVPDAVCQVYDACTLAAALDRGEQLHPVDKCLVLVIGLHELIHDQEVAPRKVQDRLVGLLQVDRQHDQERLRGAVDLFAVLVCKAVIQPAVLVYDRVVFVVGDLADILPLVIGHDHLHEFPGILRSQLFLGLADVADRGPVSGVHDHADQDPAGRLSDGTDREVEDLADLLERVRRRVEDVRRASEGAIVLFDQLPVVVDALLFIVVDKFNVLESSQRLYLHSKYTRSHPLR